VENHGVQLISSETELKNKLFSRFDRFSPKSPVDFIAAAIDASKQVKDSIVNFVESKIFCVESSFILTSVNWISLSKLDINWNSVP